jgi:hypothetical protein
MKLSRLPDRTPVKLTTTLMPNLAARLRDYADFYAETYSTREEVRWPTSCRSCWKRFWMAMRISGGRAGAAIGESLPAESPGSQESARPAKVQGRELETLTVGKWEGAGGRSDGGCL